MTTITKTITVEAPDGEEIEVSIELDLVHSPGTPGSLSDSTGWEVVSIRLSDE